MIDNQEQIKKEVDELLKDYPELKQFRERMSVIEELVKEAEAESDLSSMAASFKAVLRLQERLHVKILTWQIKKMQEQFKALENIANKSIDEYEGALKILQEERNNVEVVQMGSGYVIRRGGVDRLINKAMQKLKSKKNSDRWQKQSKNKNRKERNTWKCCSKNY